MNEPLLRILASAGLFVAVCMIVVHGRTVIGGWARAQEQAFDLSLRRRLLMDIKPRTAVIGTVVMMGAGFAVALLITTSMLFALLVAAAMLGLPHLLIRHMAEKRRRRLDEQLVDALNTLASGVRAGLNLVQALDLVVDNHAGPVQEEFRQVLREYAMGRDLNEAFGAASDRIGSPLYRLTFTAIQSHRLRGGDTGASLDRISEAVRNIHAMEGKLDALTAQGRTQAWMMAVMPVVFLAILYMIDPEGVAFLFYEPIGRIIMLVVLVMIVAGFLWIRRIMSVNL